jgi:hypothetical protein
MPPSRGACKRPRPNRHRYHMTQTAGSGSFSNVPQMHVWGTSSANEQSSRTPANNERLRRWDSGGGTWPGWSAAKLGVTRTQLAWRSPLLEQASQQESWL